MARCSYRYDSGDRCMYDDYRVKDGGMCPAHTIISGKARQARTRRARNKVEVEANGMPERLRRPKAKAEHKGRQPSRVQSAREVIDKLPPPPTIGPPEDPTAPYCTCWGRTADHEPCVGCGKPHYMDWVKQRRDARREATG